MISDKKKNQSDNEEEKLQGADKPSLIKKYELSTQFKELDLPKFIAISSVVYVGENFFYYPFDVVRTRLQTIRGGENFSFGTSITLGKQLGWKGLYRGFWTSSIGALPPHAIYFLSYNYWKDQLQSIHDRHYHNKNKNSSQTRVEGKQAIWVSFVAGGLADFFANFVMVPYEIVVQRIQIQGQSISSTSISSSSSSSKSSSNVQYKGGIDAVKSIYRQEGVRGFYRGFGASLLAYAPASAIWWASYEQSKAQFSEYLERYQQTKPNLKTDTKTDMMTDMKTDSQIEKMDRKMDKQIEMKTYSNNSKTETGSELIIHQHISAQILAGAVAGWITTITTNPMDVIKTRLQTQHYQLKFDKNKNITIYSNGWSAFRIMLKEEGWRSFTRGIGPKLFTTTIFSSWFGLAYEFILNESKKKN